MRRSRWKTHDRLSIGLGLSTRHSPHKSGFRSLRDTPSVEGRVPIELPSVSVSSRTPSCGYHVLPSRQGVRRSRWKTQDRLPIGLGLSTQHSPHKSGFRSLRDTPSVEGVVPNQLQLSTGMQKSHRPGTTSRTRPAKAAVRFVKRDKLYVTVAFDMFPDQPGNFAGNVAIAKRGRC